MPAPSAERAPIISYGTHARLGMLLPSGNTLAEPQVQAMLPNGISLHTTRLKLTGTATEQLMRMADEVEAAAELLADAAVALIVFHCTAVTTWDAGLEEDIKRRIASATGLPATSTAAALVAAFAVLQARRVVLVSPYPEAINLREAAYLGTHGVDVVAQVGLGCRDAASMAAVTPDEWRRLVLAQRQENADAYFISCTTVRSAEVISDLEREIGKPVVTSNQAMAWHCTRMLGCETPVHGFGRLLEQH